MSFGASIFAQTIYTPQNRRNIVEKAEAFSRQSDSSYRKSLQLAKQRGFKLKDSTGKGQYIELQQINSLGEPLYIGHHSNLLAGNMTRTSLVYSGGLLGLNLSGKSDTMAAKLAMWDGGNALSTHQEFGSRIKLQENLSGTDIHGTHVAGILASAGINSTSRGMAWGAEVKVWDFNNDNSEMSLAAANLLISNHSYGYQAGWVYDSTNNKWQWWGNDAMSATEDYKFGFYDSNAQTYDKIAFNAPAYLIVKSAGNSRNTNGPEAGQYYFLRNSTKDSSNLARSKNDGYDIISTTGTAKNILTVGAISLSTMVPEKSLDVSLASFSSWGPTDDGRIKPDIVGVGTNMLSTSNESNTSYTTLSGTSMSSPQVAGSLFLLQQLYNRLNKNTFMRSATLKGLVLHTALDVGAVGPDYQTGWGLLDMEKASKFILNKDGAQLIAENVLSNGKTEKRTFTASGKGNLEATISWTDPEANVTSLIADNLNSRAPKLVNDLDIKISDENGTYLPFILDPASPEKLASKGDNIRDNIEKIILVGAVPGKSYDLTISHKGTLKNDKQEYSLLVSGIGGTAYCKVTPTYYQNMVTSFTVGNFNNTNSKTQDFTSTPISVELGSTNNLAISFSNNANKRVKLVVDWNQDGDFDDVGEVALASETISSATYSGKFNTPPQVSINQYYRMRLVSEFSNSAPNACGNINTGESEEYIVQVIQASNDLGVLSISNPTNNYCATNGLATMQIKVKNFGSKAQKDVPLTLSYYLNESLQGSLKGIIPAIGSGNEQTLLMSGEVIWSAGKTYSIRANVGLPTDQNALNDLVTINQTIENPQAPVGTGTYCSGATALNLNATQGFPLWYSNNVVVGSGNTVSLPYGTNYTVGSNDFSGTIKPQTKKEFGTGNYFENFGPTPIFDIKAPVILESARIYVGTSGTITFSVFNKDTGELISSVSKDVAATRTQTNATRVNNQLSDDKNDPGQVVQLNLQFPKTGTYIVSQTCSNGASIFRSNKTLADTVNTPVNLGYPYIIPNILSLTGALFNGAPITTAYYYFYDMKFKSLGCPSPRAPVSITNAKSPDTSIPTTNQTICEGATVTITAKYTDTPSFQWLLNGAAIQGATLPTLEVKKSGKYQIQSSLNGLCTTISNAYTLSIGSPLAPLISYQDGNLKSSTGTDMQWYFNGTILNGATQSTIVPVQSGSYVIKMKDINGCLTTSESITITILSTNKENPFHQIVAYPNPAKDQLMIGLPNPIEVNYRVELSDINGRVLSNTLEILPAGENKLILNISKLPSGTYLIRLPEVQNGQSLKFIKQ